jgi:gas vesicle protein
MTENQWSDDPAYRVSPTTPGTTGERSASTVPAAAAPQTGDAYGTSRKDAVKEEAGDVARTAADSAQSVAQTAKSEAANVATEVKANTKDLLHQARTDLTQQAGAQQQKVADGLRSVSDELHAMARASDQPGVASDLVRQAAERSSSVAAWLDGRDPGSLLDEVKSFARQRPGTFLLLAAGAGVLAGRLSRSLSAGAPESTPRSAAGYPDQYTGDQYTGDQYTGDQYTGDKYTGDQYTGDQYTGERYAGEQYGTGQGVPGGFTPSGGGAVPPPAVQLPGPATTTAGFDGGAPGSSYADSPTAASPLDSPQLVEEPRSGNRTADDPLREKELADEPMGQDPLTRDRSADGQAGRP